MENKANKYVLDGFYMKSKEETHEYIAKVLEFPDYYGKNLDALFDMLTTTKMSIEMTNCVEMLNALKNYGCKLLIMMFDAANENPEFTFSIADHRL